ncbi:MAG: ABC transporter ATP-binding protein [Corynebacterium sp.]|uniref:ABC transporter ATP-binding protein n=1 Tax=Corynebacterium sp. TaxID=1720 RepID=UPI0026DBC6D7|nr:ABC transporter ATP-binding protein [Corynebacterium sp.]MDO5029371.1 ABC transporter ATP-binding protein [Corynebacterium sp.]
MKNISPKLEATNVRCDIAGRTIVDDVNLQFGDEAMTAIVGINGAGKSTLLRVLAGIDAPSAGQVHLNGHQMSTLDSRKRARDLAFVAQSEIPPAEMRVRDFVSLGRLPYQRLFAGNSEEDCTHIQKALAKVELDDLAYRACGQLSGGQRRRVCLARAIAQDSPLMLLDEPTNHLDVRHQQAVLRLARNTGTCVIAAIHDLDLVMNHFDRVIVIADGGVVADGAPREVLSHTLVAEVFHVASHQLNSPTGRRHLAIDSELHHDK